MAKTYIPSAVDISSAAKKYLTRYQNRLIVGATSNQITALADLIICLTHFLVEWNKPPPV
jgi:hypothetical protein